MLMLKNLTLESLMLRENGLDKVKEFFPSLRVLNLISVGGLIGPKIHLLHLKTCQWCIFDDQPSLTIQTPMLMDLELKFGEIQTLILKAPLLSALYLSMTKASEVFEVEEFNNLKSLHIESRDLCNLIKLFPECNIVEKLVLDSPNWVDLRPTVKENVSFEKLMSKFPNVSDLSLRPGAWVKLEKSFLGGGLEAVNGWKTLKQLMAHLVVYDVETTRHFISSILERFPTLSEMKMLVHRGVASDVRSHLISSCMADCPRIKWRWGKWSLGQNDTWVSDGI
ncbi:hypothetical protein BVC80_41g48 [Macleaya cordata]|uniref:FBD domain n=1 Tax=Macleaya cordata TaxID=56857 RepID=A0A200QMT8_MACCD|nr:hypothetical protein BVC80_41g48 [Macleaya cordata]